MRKGRLAWIVVCGLMLAVAAVLSGCSDDSNTRTVEVNKSVRARTISAERSAVPQIRTYSGRVRAKVSVTLAPKMPGNVKEVPVQIGDRVRRGQLLLKVDDTDLRARLRALSATRRSIQKRLDAISARYEYARINLERYRRLFGQEAATKDELDRAETEFSALQGQMEAIRSELSVVDAQMAEVRNQLDYMVIRSPIDGWISSRSVDPGTYVNPGVPVITVDSAADGFWFEAEVDEATGLKIRPGTKASVSIPASGLDVVVTIAHVRPGSNPATHTTTILADMQDYPVKSGLYGRLSIPVGTSLAILLPAEAIVDRGGLSGVFVVDDHDRARWRIVKTGKRWRKDGSLLVPIFSGQQPSAAETEGPILVTILSGLSQGERVVVSPLSEVREGVHIE